MTRLAHVPELMPTETLDGFVSRLAAANGAPNSYVFRKHMGIRLDKRFDGDRTLPALSALSGLHADALASRAIRWEPKLVSFSGVHLTYKMVHMSSPRYCPRCVEHDMAMGRGRLEARPWIRASWFAIHNEICKEHGTRIFTSPVPYLRGSRHDFANYLRSHHSEFETALADRETFVLHPYDRYFADRFEEAHATMELLDPLPYYVASRLCTILGTMACNGDRNKRRPAPVVNADDSRRFGFELLGDRSKLLGFLSELNVKYLNRKRSTKGLALYGDLQKFLGKHIDVPELRPFIEMVREHAMDAVPIGPADAFIGGGGVRRWHTLRSAMLETGMHSLRLRKVLIERGILVDADRKTPDNKVVCRVSDIEKAVSDYNDRVDANQIPAMLGVSVTTVTSLIRKDILRPIFGSEKDMHPKYSKKAVKALLDDLFESAEVREEDDAVVSLLKAVPKAGCSMADIVLALMDGRIQTRYVTKESSKVGLARLLVDPAEVKSTFARPHYPGVTRVEFRRATGNDNDASMALMHSGFFQVFQVKGRGPSTDKVTHESFDAFFDKHASLAELAEGWMMPRQLRRALTNAGIHPVWALGHRRAYTFYRRSDVAAHRLRNP